MGRNPAADLKTISPPWQHCSFTGDNMTASFKSAVASPSLAAFRADYDADLLSKIEYNGAIWNLHQRLFEYVSFLSGTNVGTIEINEDGVMFRLRDPRITLRCTPGDQRHVAITNLNFRQYESQELRVVMCLTKVCSVFFDVGANTGFYSIAVAQRFPDLKVVAFEPIPATYNELRYNLALNNVTNVVTHNVGLSDRACNAPFYFDSTVPGATSAAPLGPEFGPTETVVCPTDTIDAFIDRTGTLPDFIKCDVEGGELSVFHGAARMFERCTPLIFTEMLRKWSARFGYHPNEIIAFLRDRGYACFVLSDGMLEPFSEMTEATMETNFFFLHTERHLDMVRFLGLLK
jgi:FkbM family methyltransferase